MELGEIIYRKFGISDPKIVRIQNDGQGAYIAVWNIPNVAKPSATDLTAWEAEMIKKKQSELALKKLAELDLQSIPSLRQLMVASSEELAKIEASATEWRKQV